MPGATALGTRATQEKRKVMSAAKNPIESSLGKTLLKTNFSDERYVYYTFWSSIPCGEAPALEEGGGGGT